LTSTGQRLVTLLTSGMLKEKTLTNLEVDIV